MIHYINLGDAERPITFSYSVAYEYELQTGKFYEQDVQELARQIVIAGAALGTDDSAKAAQSLSIVKFVDILHACLLVGCRKTATPVNFTKYDVADWLGGNPEAVARFTTLLLEANFGLPGEATDDAADPDFAEASSGKGKKKRQAR